MSSRNQSRQTSVVGKNGVSTRYTYSGMGTDKEVPDLGAAAAAAVDVDVAVAVTAAVAVAAAAAALQ